LTNKNDDTDALLAAYDGLLRLGLVGWDMIDTKGSICWMNPPFSRSTEMFKQFFKVVHRGVAIYRCDNIETKLWYNIFKNATWVFIPNKRIEYEGIDGKGSRFPSALIGFNVETPEGIEGQP